VRRLDGRVVLLTESAVAVFDAERQKETDERMYGAARRRWLALAANVKASPARRSKLARAPLSAETVEAARHFYLVSAEQAVRLARRDRRWGDVGRIRREQAAALYREIGSPVPPPEAIMELQREGMSAVLRSLSALARNAEIVGAGCCRACREADGTIVKIAAELREPRLPHAGCPRGLCGCDWWIAVADRKPSRRRRPAAGSAGAAARPGTPVGPAGDPGAGEVAGATGEADEIAADDEVEPDEELDLGTRPEPDEELADEDLEPDEELADDEDLEDESPPGGPGADGPGGTALEEISPPRSG
jgi:hypothetical protein